jgi:hypothetical protein
MRPKERRNSGQNDFFQAHIAADRPLISRSMSKTAVFASNAIGEIGVARFVPDKAELRLLAQLFAVEPSLPGTSLLVGPRCGQLSGVLMAYKPERCFSKRSIRSVRSGWTCPAFVESVLKFTRPASRTEAG